MKASIRQFQEETNNFMKLRCRRKLLNFKKFRAMKMTRRSNSFAMKSRGLHYNTESIPQNEIKSKKPQNIL